MINSAVLEIMNRYGVSAGEYSVGGIRGANKAVIYIYKELTTESYEGINRGLYGISYTMSNETNETGTTGETERGGKTRQVYRVESERLNGNCLKYKYILRLK